MVRGNNSVGVNKPTGWGFLRLLPLQVVGDSGPWPQPPGLQALKSNLDCSTVTGRQLKPRPAQSRLAPRRSLLSTPARALQARPWLQSAAVRVTSQAPAAIASGIPGSHRLSGLQTRPCRCNRLAQLVTSWLYQL
jgi:hypothetical protein